MNVAIIFCVIAVAIALAAFVLSLVGARADRPRRGSPETPTAPGSDSSSLVAWLGTGDSGTSHHASDLSHHSAHQDHAAHHDGAFHGSTNSPSDGGHFGGDGGGHGGFDGGAGHH